jgi:hypothetical protein
LLFHLFAGSAQFVDHGPAGRRQRDSVASSVGWIGLTFDEVALLQHIDHRHGVVDGGRRG